jgi:putative tRNA adenosine deaminase-associated protein
VIVVMTDETAVDFAVVAVRDGARWSADRLPPRAASDLPALLAALRAQSPEGTSLALVSYGDDFFVLARADGGRVRLLLSDATAAAEWPVAEQVLDELGIPVPDDDDELEEVAPAGDLALLADLGVPAMDLGEICADLEAYPDETLGTIASRLGFGTEFEAAVEAELR